MEKIINNCTEVKSCNYGSKILKKEEERRFRANLGLKEDNIIITEEYSISSKIMEVFAKENIKLQHFVLGCHIDLYFPKYRLAVEIDGKVRLGRNENKDKQREDKIKEALECEFIRINPSKEKFNINIFVEIGKIYDKIDEIKGKIKNKLIDEIKRKCKENPSGIVQSNLKKLL